MSSQVNGSPLFTIEQIELIRRLRNSGITKEQIVQAFESLERLDRELGPVYSVPVTLTAFQYPNFPRTTFTIPTSANAPQVIANSVANSIVSQVQQAQQQQAAVAAAVAQQAAVAVQQQVQQAQQQQQQTQQQQQQAVQVQQAIQAPPQPQQPPTPKANIVIRKRSGDDSNDSASNTSSIDINGIQVFGEEDIDVEEYKEFISQPDPQCCEEIKAFVIKHNIKQQQIATLSGISQSYVSRYLKGDYYDMSERSRRAIQKWFILYRKNPAAIGPAVNAVLLSTNGAPPPKKLINAIDICAATNGNSDFITYPRRERFVFRPNHLELMERYFAEDNYPSHEKREEIARACNAATESVAGRELTDRERVTSQIVSNWFANKRKELKKIAREEGLDVSHVPMRPRGRPSRLFNEFALLQQERSVINNGQIEEVMKDATCEAADGDPGAVDSSGLIDSHHDLANNLAVQDDQSLSLSVEIAAVNQAILSLTGQQPINIKSERAEKEPSKDESTS